MWLCFYHFNCFNIFPSSTIFGQIYKLVPICLFYHSFFYLIIQERKRLAAEEKKAKKLAKKQRKKQEASKLKAGECKTKVQENSGLETTDCESMTDVIMVCKSDAVELTAEDDVGDATEPPALLFTKTFDEV